MQTPSCAMCVVWCKRDTTEHVRTKGAKSQEHISILRVSRSPTPTLDPSHRLFIPQVCRCDASPVPSLNYHLHFSLFESRFDDYSYVSIIETGGIIIAASKRWKKPADDRGGCSFSFCNSFHDGECFSVEFIFFSFANGILRMKGSFWRAQLTTFLCLRWIFEELEAKLTPRLILYRVYDKGGSPYTRSCFFLWFSAHVCFTDTTTHRFTIGKTGEDQVPYWY